MITAHLRCGVISDEWLPLDGILLYEATRREGGGPAEASIPGSGSLDSHEHSPTPPLLLIQDGDIRYWACSFAEWGEPYAEGRDYWNKREDSGQFGDFLDRAAGRIQISKGRYKAYHMPVFYRVAPWVRWWAVGDKEGVASLLEKVDAIGKKRAYGWGEVIRWEVQEAREDRSVFVAAVPQRSVPVTSRTEMIVPPDTRRAFWGYYPPYYDRCNQTICFLPPGLRRFRSSDFSPKQGLLGHDNSG